jgi:hypothetical protein
MNAGAESAAFQALQQMQSSINASRAEHHQQAYPDALPSMNLAPYAQKYYRFDYLPTRSANGEIVGYHHPRNSSSPRLQFSQKLYDYG